MNRVKIKKFNEMGKMKNCMVALLVSLSSIWLSGCGDNSEEKLNEKLNENALLVKKAFEYLNEENLNGLFPIVSDSITDYQAIKKTLGGHIFASGIEIRVESSTPDRVYFTCLIPGATSVVVYNLLDRKFSLKVSEAMSMNISWRGSVNILTDQKTGEKKIDISDKKNPFSFYLNIAYNGLLESPLKVSDLTTNDKYVDAINLLIWIVGSTYTPIFNDQNYISNVVVPDINRVFGDEKMMENIITSGAKEELSGAKKNEEIKITIEKNTVAANEKNVKTSTKIEPSSSHQKTDLYSTIGGLFLKYWWIVLIAFIGLSWYILSRYNSINTLLFFYVVFLFPFVFFGLLLLGIYYPMDMGIAEGINFFYGTNVNPKINSTEDALLAIIAGVLLICAIFLFVLYTLPKWMSFIERYFAAWDSNNKNKRTTAVEKTTDEGKLHRILKYARYVDVRVLAIGKITDKHILHKAALKDEESEVRMAAVRKITDKGVLKKVAFEDWRWNVREQAVIRITDEEVLKKIALEDRSEEVRLVAVRKITDEEVLKKVALEDRSEEVRLVAVRKITNEVVLKEIALSYNHTEVCSQAIEKIRDREFTKEIALKASKSDVRKDAVSKITDAEVLKKVALHDTNGEVRLEAVSKITDETLLKEVVIKDSDSNVRKKAFQKISNETLLKEIVLNSSDTDVCKEALRKIPDEAFPKEIAFKASNSALRKEAINMITDESILKEIVLIESEKNNCKEALNKITDETILEELLSESTDYDICKLATDKLAQNDRRLLLSDHVSIFLNPKEAVTIGNTRKQYLSFEFSNHLKTGKKYWTKSNVAFGNETYEKSRFYEITKSGWSLAALGRLITKDCTPEQFKKSLDSFDNSVIPEYNRDCNKLNELDGKARRINEIQSILKSHKRQAGSIFPEDSILEEERKSLISSYNSSEKELKPVIERIERGILTYADEAKVLPFGFFMQVINDSQGRFDRFIRQGAIMGMIDFFFKYRDHSIIKPYFENLIAARTDMISSDNRMSFFEVRAPKNCTAKEYAVILKAVLQCANPTINYCDTERLMEIAEQEIPGIMDLLVHYPLRLIDPGNETTEGFYTFEPYRHAMWVRYTPPLNVGQVQKRYHEVLDMTLPNSSGLNIRLFTDPYAAVPVMFHEYNHYMEDPNEASVFLKTHAFSMQFYRKYKDADPAKDAVFVHLNQLLGKDADAGKFAELNKLILKYYGAPKTNAEAEAAAEADLSQKNLYVQYSNQRETWCPNVKMPLLHDSGDKDNADLIKKIVIRYAQVPRTITRKEFTTLWANYMSIFHAQYALYKALVPEMFSNKKSDTSWKEKIEISYPQWKSFKDWCVEKAFIKEYK